MIEYLEQHWSTKEREAFVARTEEVIDFITKRPKQYVYSSKRDAYRAVLTKHVSLYYRILDSEVELLTFWDTRQDPENLRI